MYIYYIYIYILLGLTAQALVPPSVSPSVVLSPLFGPALHLRFWLLGFLFFLLLSQRRWLPPLGIRAGAPRLVSYHLDCDSFSSFRKGGGYPTSVSEPELPFFGVLYIFVFELFLLFLLWRRWLPPFDICRAGAPLLRRALHLRFLVVLSLTFVKVVPPPPRYPLGKT